MADLYEARNGQLYMMGWTARKAPPMDTEFEEVPPSEAKRLPKPSKAMRIVK